MTLNCESNIHFHPSTLTAIGRVKGMTMSARTILRPLNGLQEKKGERGAQQALEDAGRRQ